MSDDDVSVRVAVRIRPLIPREIINMCRVCAQVTPGEPQITLGSNKAFTYDYVFETHEQQEAVYDTCVQSLVDGVLEGYNATVLAYGQTGSGKTYTMGTGFDVEVAFDQVGIIPRAIRNIFDSITDRIQRAKDQGQMAPEFKVGVQFMELYNEDIRDLFNPIQSYDKAKEYKIHEDPKVGIYVKGITMKPVMSAEDALQCLKLGALSRTTASTQMNTESSRSHAIFTLHIKQQRLVTMDDDMGGGGDAPDEPLTEFETLTAKFHFVDLAGSERLKRTCATGERAKEGISINYGLLALGNVISALGDVTKKATHVPYRDSKLTRLLQDSLGGNSQTVMIACISPSDSDFMETLNTLKYANRARNIQNRITVNQDKGSRTIAVLRQQIAKLELELLEYKQGKRIVGEDGTEMVNDMFYENNMLQSELNTLRTRVKAMQETIDALSAKNTTLLAEKATGNWIGGSPDSDVTAIIQDYLKEIEDLRAKLMESNFMCEQLRKTAARAQENYNRNLMNSSVLDPMLDTQSVIEEAKKDLQREKEILERNKHNEDGGGGDDNADSSDSDSDSDSDTDSEGNTTEMRGELAVLNNNIQDKEALINQLESLQQRLHIMRQQYEEKLMQLQTRIKITQEERDKVLQSFTGQNSEPTEKVKRIKDDYEKKLKEMQKELKILQTAKKEHQRLLRTQNENEKQLRDLRNGLDELKRTKVKLMSKMKEESQRHRQTDTRRIREIETLKKEARRNANVIRSMEADRRIKEQVLRRKQEEVSALRRENKRGLSLRAAGRVVHGKKKSARELKNKWNLIENKVTKAAIAKKTMVEQEQKMDKLLKQRERLNKDYERNQEKMGQLMANGQDCTEIKNLIDDLSANIAFVNESIKELQTLIVQEEEAPQEPDEIADVLQTIYDIEDARFLLQKLFTMTVNQSFEVEKKNVELGKKEEIIKQTKDDKHMCSQLLEHMIHSDFSLFSNNMITSMSSNANESDDSTNSSRSESPVQLTQSEEKKQIPMKVRRRTALPSELLFGSPKSEANDNIMTQSQDASTLREDHPIVRVPSAPGSLKGLLPLPKSVERSVYVSQTSRPVHRIPLPVHSTKHGSIGTRYPNTESNVLPVTHNTLTLRSEQGLDWDSASPPASPIANRKMVSRDDNVFSRLFSTNQTESPTQRGHIVPYVGKVQPKASLQCVAVAKGHNNAVLSVYATDETLFTGAADRIVKVWDLQTNCEIHTLHGHPSNVVSVRYNPMTQLLLSASLSYVKVWDLRFSNVRCVKVLCSSGMTQAGTSLSVVSSNRTVQIPLGECAVNDVAFNTSGSLIFAAASDKVRIWDIRKFLYIGKLSTDHRAPVMCLAVDKINSCNDMVVTGSKDHFIKVFNISSLGKGNFAPTMNLEPPHYDGIQCLAVGKDVLFSGSRDMCIKKWDLKKQELVQSLNNAHRGWICGMALIREDRLLLSGCRSGFLKLWDAQTCDQLADVRAHSTSVNAIATNSNNIFTASNCGEVKIWKQSDN